MGCLVILGAAFAIAFALQWTTRRWWVAVFLPAVVIEAIRIKGAVARQELGQLQSEWALHLFILGIVVFACSWGYLGAKALQNRKDESDVL
jgi:general stress protein CsbA